jgi:hypothetical protein
VHQANRVGTLILSLFRSSESALPDLGIIERAEVVSGEGEDEEVVLAFSGIS